MFRPGPAHVRGELKNVITAIRLLPPSAHYRFGNTRRVWPPPQVQIAHPSLGVATLVNGARFRARAGLGDFLKSAGAGGGGGGSKGGDDDEVTKLIDKYGDRIGEVGFGGVGGFCSG